MNKDLDQSDVEADGERMLFAQQDRASRSLQGRVESLVGRFPELTPFRDRIQKVLVARDKAAQPSGHPGHYHVGRNVPGYLPEAPVACYDDLYNALAGLRERLNDQGAEYDLHCQVDGLGECDECECECDWSRVARNAYADVAAIANLADTGYLAISRGGLDFSYVPPEGSPITHWLNIEPGPQDACEGDEAS